MRGEGNAVLLRAERCFGILGKETRVLQQLGRVKRLERFNDLFRFDPTAYWHAYLTLGTRQEEKLGPDDQE
jgi:hypothetical protein